MNKEFLTIMIAISSFAGLGCFIRTGLSGLCDCWALLSLIPNMFGSFLLGIINGLSLNNKYTKTGLGTGLCGSITTFSSFSYEFNVLIINKEPNIGLALAFLAITFIGSAKTYFIGQYISEFYLKMASTKEDKSTTVVEMTKCMSNSETNDNIDGPNQEKQDENENENKLLIYWIIIFILINAIIIPLSFILIDDRFWFAILLSPFGANLRWYLGMKFNKNKFKFPFGTFSVNILGALLLTLLLIITGESENPKFETIFVEAMTKGFCGCLSTVSSFIAELFVLSNEEAKYIPYMPFLYFFCTIIVSQILCSIPTSIYIFS